MAKRLLSVGLLLGLGAAATAPAATFLVDTTTDAVDDSPGDGICATAGGACALRAAIQEANALAGPDHIDLPAGVYLLTLAGPGEDAGASGDLDVHESLSIAGAGAATTIIDAGGASPVLEAREASFPPPPSSGLVISGVTLRNGAAQTGDDCDGVIALSGVPGLCGNGIAIELTDSVVEDNAGDGVEVLGDLTLTRTTVRNNVKLGSLGGGVTVFFGSLTITDSTISGNGSFGIFAPATPVTLRNSTVSGNGRTGLSIGFFCEPLPCPVPAPVTLSNVTMSGHTVAAVNNVIRDIPSGTTGTAPVVVRNSVFSGNAAECEGSLLSDGYNLFAAPGGCAIVPAVGDLVGVPGNLGPLQANGGPTETHAPGPTSPVVNAANPAAPGSGGSACEATDQRGVARPIGAVCDMGAVETSCGDGVQDPGEACDDGNPTNGDGCQRNCTLPGCGNGILEAGEACDDGNTLGGDCCTATCTLDPPGTACTSDGDQCTVDACDGAGQCLHPTAPDGTSCDDGNACSLDDQCHSGNCLGFGCPFCTICSPGVGCVAPPDTCQEAARSRVKLSDKPGSDNDVARWTWVGPVPVTTSEFGGVPSGLCGEDDRGLGFLVTSTGASGGCDSFGCWTASGKRLKFTSGQAAAGKVKIVFVEGPPPQIVVRAKGPSVDSPGLPLSPPVRLWYQRVDNGRCWDATYDAAGVRRNTPNVFQAR